MPQINFRTISVYIYIYIHNPDSGLGSYVNTFAEDKKIGRWIRPESTNGEMDDKYSLISTNVNVLSISRKK